MAREISQSATGYALGNLLTSLIAGVVVFVTLVLLGVPFPLLWALWVTLVDFLPMVGGALAGIPTVLFAFGHSVTGGIVTAAAFLAYQQIENHVLISHLLISWPPTMAASPGRAAAGGTGTGAARPAGR